MSQETGLRLLQWLLARFYRMLFTALFLGFGLLWAALGLGWALLVTALGALGWLLGKWVDEGRPDAGLSRRLRRFFDEG